MKMETEIQLTADDLVAKYKLTEAERSKGIATIKATDRNSPCPCGCGKKTKNCDRGRMVLHFKKNFLKGSILTEVLAALVMFGLAFAVIAIIRDTNPQHPTPSFFRAGEAGKGGAT